MNTDDVIPENPYFNIHDHTVDIFYRKKACSVPIANIRKMYLSRRKVRNWTSIPGASLFLPDNGYKLHIATDEKEIIFTIKSFEKQYFVRLISWVRNRTS